MTYLGKLAGKRVRIIATGMDLPDSMLNQQGKALHDIGVTDLGIESGEYFIKLDSGEYIYAPSWKIEEVK